MRITRMITISPLLATGLIVALGGPETTSQAQKKHKTNFFGTLTTQEDNVMEVENISFEGKIRQIPVYEYPRSKREQQNGKTEIILTNDPNKNLVSSYLDLDELKEIRVPNPSQTWIYRREKSQRKVEFIEVEVVSKADTVSHYLVNQRSRLYCHGITKSGPEEKKVPLLAIKSLTINGFCVRDDKTGVCPIPPSKLMTKEEAEKEKIKMQKPKKGSAAAAAA